MNYPQIVPFTKIPGLNQIFIILRSILWIYQNPGYVSSCYSDSEDSQIREFLFGVLGVSNLHTSILAELYGDESRVMFLAEQYISR